MNHESKRRDQLVLPVALAACGLLISGHGTAAVTTDGRVGPIQSLIILE